MKTRGFCACLLLAGVLALCAQAADPAGPALPPSMTIYYLGLLTRGPRADAIPREELPALQAGHMANIERLAKEGKLLVAGPFLDDGDWRGVFIFKCASLEEARSLAATDPAIRAGRLQIDIRPWLTMKGNIRDPEFPVAPAASAP